MGVIFSLKQFNVVVVAVVTVVVVVVVVTVAVVIGDVSYEVIARVFESEKFPTGSFFQENRKENHFLNKIR